MYNIICNGYFHLKKDTVYTYISYMKHSHGKKAHIYFLTSVQIYSVLYNNNLSLSPQL